MGNDPRGYRVGTERGLYLYSRGTCYKPSCNEPVMKSVEDRQVCVAFIAHIEAARPGGPRYRDSMTNRERSAFNNLILLCKPHHDLVDDLALVKDYPVSLLVEWKVRREKPLADSLVGLSTLTKDSLVSSMESTVNQTNELILSLGVELKTQGNEILSAVASILEDLVDRPFLTDESVISLSRAAEQLSGLEEFSASLSDSAYRLQGLQDSSYALQDSASKLVGLGDNSFVLHSAAQKLDPERLESLIDQLLRTLNIERLEALVDSVQGIELDRMQQGIRITADDLKDTATTSIQNMERALERLDAVSNRVRNTDLDVVVNDPQRMRYFWVGLALGLGIGLVILYLSITGSAPA